MTDKILKSNNAPSIEWANQTCGNCKHWKRNKPAKPWSPESKHENWLKAGTCSVIIIDYGRYTSGLISYEDFGCIDFEAK
jgi:hypothetical protein